MKKRASIRWIVGSAFLLMAILLVSLMLFRGETARKSDSSEDRFRLSGSPTKGLDGSIGGSILVQLHDFDLTDQEGNRVRFVRDVLGEKMAVITPFFTSCTTVCPVMSYMLRHLQELLGERLGQSVVLVSVTIDPQKDIPERLKAYALQQKARPGWVFLTGQRQKLGQVLFGIGALSSAQLDKQSHLPVTVVGSARGPWKRLQGFASAREVLTHVNALQAQKEQL